MPCQRENLCKSEKSERLNYTDNCRHLHHVYLIFSASLRDVFPIPATKQNSFVFSDTDSGHPQSGYYVTTRFDSDYRCSMDVLHSFLDVVRRRLSWISTDYGIPWKKYVSFSATNVLLTRA